MISEIQSICDKEHIINALRKAENGESKLSFEALSVPGFTSIRIRNFLNNICDLPDLRYLEIGMHQGATLVAAMYKNHGLFIGIDNFSEFNEEKTTKLSLMNHLQQLNLTPIIVDNDCWSIETVALCPFKINVFFYDGPHDYDSQRNALNVYYHHLAKEFIYIVDDWNWENTSKGTRDSIKETQLDILYAKEIFTPKKANGCNDDWWNGLAIYLLRKK